MIALAGLAAWLAVCALAFGVCAMAGMADDDAGLSGEGWPR